MLSNKDFAALVEKSDFSKDNKVRFDLKQISEWDKQNNAKFKRKSNNKSYNREDNSESQSNKQKFASLYRDRANERRKDIKNEGDQAIEEMVAKLDAEQTKFLGGDIEHTHLVKGLDYVLLKKIRGEGTSSLNEFAEQEAASTIVVNDDTKAPHDIVIESSLGQAVNRVLFGHELRNLNEKKMKNPGLLLRRCAFEFDLDPLSEADVPTMISRSKLVSLFNCDHHSIDPISYRIITMTNQ
jgi:IK cytokine